MSSSRREWIKFAAQVLDGQWFSIFASFLIMAGSGATFLFGVYSKDIKAVLGYDQTTLNLLGFFKDLGSSVGVLSGLIAEVTPTWFVLLVGAALNFAGYFLIWLTITQKIPKPQLWHMCLFICVGANSQNFSNTGALVTCVKNFPVGRGYLLGLLKGYVGLSGAIFTQIYLALYGSDDSKSLVLLIAWLPAALSVVFVYTIRERRVVRTRREKKVFFDFLYVSVATAVVLLALTVMERVVRFGPAAYSAGAAVSCLMLFVPLLVAVREERALWRARDIPRAVAAVVRAPATFPAKSVSGNDGAVESQGRSRDSPASFTAIPVSGNERNIENQGRSGDSPSRSVAVRSPAMPVSGNDGSAENQGQTGGSEARSAAVRSPASFSAIPISRNDVPAKNMRLSGGSQAIPVAVSSPASFTSIPISGNDVPTRNHQGHSGDSPARSVAVRSLAVLAGENSGHSGDKTFTLARIAGGCGGAWGRCIRGVLDKPPRGEDYTILQALLSLDMAVLFLVTFCGFGSSLTAVDNLGQIGESLGYPRGTVKAFLSLVSIWNFFGRVFSGFASEALLIRYKFPRPLMMTVVLIVSCVGNLMIAFPTPGSVYLASVLIGFALGAQLPLIFAIISELFGLKYYSTLFNCGQLASPVGSYVLNVRVTGMLYDRAAVRQLKARGLARSDVKELVCIGASCYREAFLILTAITALGAVASLILVARTRQFYKSDIYEKFRRQAEVVEIGPDQEMGRK